MNVGIQREVESSDEVLEGFIKGWCGGSIGCGADDGQVHVSSYRRIQYLNPQQRSEEGMKVHCISITINQPK